MIEFFGLMHSRTIGNGIPATNVRAAVAESTEAVACSTLCTMRKASFTGGGESGPLAELLTADIVCRVPGNSPIAGQRCSASRRRDLASGTFRMPA